MVTKRAKPKRAAPAAVVSVPLDADALRDRIVEFRRVPSAELEDHAKNWRVHPYAQSRALAEILEKVGIAGALTAYYSDRNDGKLTLIDGHERRGKHDADWPTLILDVSDDEADLLLLTLDPIVGMADTDTSALTELLDDAGRAGTPGLEELFRLLTLEASDGGDDDGDGGSDDGLGGPPEMELQAFEHYDYVVVLCRSSLDWMQLQERLGIRREAFTLKDGKTRKIGRGRVIDAARLLRLLE